jgi:hypothetical protein
MTWLTVVLLWVGGALLLTLVMAALMAGGQRGDLRHRGGSAS